MEHSSIIAIDPGASGAFCVIHPSGHIGVQSMPRDEIGVVNHIRLLAQECQIARTQPTFVLEQVQGYIGKSQTGSSMFTFGKGYGFLRGCIMATGNAIVDVTPQRWQGELRDGLTYPKADLEQKEWLDRNARDLYPNLKFPKSAADAVLIAHWASLFLGLL